MAWTKLRDRIAALPLVLCGPIVRRVTVNRATVWIALRQSRTVTLKIYEGTGNSRTVVMAGTAVTKRFGEHLHVAAVTAPAFSTPDPPDKLKPGHIYEYDLELGPGTTLSSPGILDSINATEKLSLGYGTAAPSFAIPAEDLNNFRLAHASCRKPHGEQGDMLPALDGILEATASSAIERPQMLFLTGDQIYADDVADALLYILTDAGDTLLGWHEVLPEINKKTEELRPGERGETCRKVGKEGLSSGETHSHLLGLGEFYAMYLATWSDVLWPAELPIFQAPTTSTGERIVDWIERFQKERTSIDVFRKSLRTVRRVLANIPTYMIFDDHEVTDDWYLNKNWRDNVSKSALGIRILQNALSAYAIFQGWGNDPAQYDSDRPGAKLLEQLVSWTGEENQTAASIRKQLNLPLSAGGAAPDGKEIIWDYEITGANHHVIVLDTRTERAFSAGNGRKPPGLISDEALQRQLRDRFQKRQKKYAITVMVSPAPVIGVDVAEGIQGFLYNLRAEQFADYEAWIFSSKYFHALLKCLVPYEQVVILSGDVHYSSAASLTYWDETSTPPRRARFIQCTSSSLKNEAFLPRTLSRRDWPSDNKSYIGWDVKGKHLETIGIPFPVLGTPPIQSVPTLNANKIIDGPNWRYRINWHIDNRQFTDRVVMPTGYPPIPEFGTSRSLDYLYKLAIEHRKRHGVDSMRAIVGRNNLALVSFTWSEGEGVREVHQSFWFSFDPDNKPPIPIAPYTVQHISSKLPGENDPKPDLTHS